MPKILWDERRRKLISFREMETAHLSLPWELEQNPLHIVTDRQDDDVDPVNRRTDRGPSSPEISVGTAALGTAETRLAKDYGLAGKADLTSSVITLKPARVHGPNEVTIATSVASRPRAIRMRPMRGWLWRASNVYQRSPR